MKENSVIYVAGHSGLVGSALVRRLRSMGFKSVVTRTHAQLDLREAAAVSAFFRDARPEYVFMAAARVGGIVANMQYPADFICDNLSMALNVITAAHRYGAKKLLFLGSSCIYPRDAPQPIPETALLSGPLEASNEAYAVAKIAGVKICQALWSQYGFPAISVMPSNLYGPGDNFDLSSSHVVPALIRKFHEAKVRRQSYVTVWGSGTPRRELLHVDDLADACVVAMERYSGPEVLNVGTGDDLTIAELAVVIQRVVGFNGEIVYDAGRPDGTPRKVLDVSRLTALGWQATIPLEQGIRNTYEWYVNSKGTK